MAERKLQVYLASTSPRRQELLQQLGVTFDILPVDIDESMREDELVRDYVCRMAIEKAYAGRRHCESECKLPVLGSDTAVVLGDRAFGKPKSRENAHEMLTALSGKSHEVMTAVALVCGERELVRLNISQVTFMELSDQQIIDYWNTGEPADKAGAYAIQGRAAKFITNLTGSFSAVMGLPLYETAELLREFNVEI